MLILTRTLGEAVWIGTDIRIVVQAFNAPRPDGEGQLSCKIGIDAPDELRILREELLKQQPKREAASSSSHADGGSDSGKRPRRRRP